MILYSNILEHDAVYEASPGYGMPEMLDLFIKVYRKNWAYTEVCE